MLICPMLLGGGRSIPGYGVAWAAWRLYLVPGRRCACIGRFSLAAPAVRPRRRLPCDHDGSAAEQGPAAARVS